MDLTQWLEYIERQHPKQIDMGLDRVRAVAREMGLQRPAPRVITVGGTNGKGSTVAFIEAMARGAGWRVGAYTSPHLRAYNERVRINGADIGDAPLVSAFEAVEEARGGVPLTYFEYGTLAALWCFEQAGLDLVVLEVGLGGRLDATNIVDPDVAVVTTVDLDHQDYLGADREAIGFEKAGIARAWKPLVLGDEDPPSSVLRHAYAIGASAVRIGCDFFFETTADGWHWRELGCEYELPLPQMAAPVQVRNAAVAIAALRALDAPLTEPVIAEAVANAKLDARLQAFDREGVAVVVDVAHNPQAARELGRWLAASPVPGTTHAVFAALGDKDVEGVVAALAGTVGCWHLAGLPHAGDRAQSGARLAARLAGTAAANATAHDDVTTALAATLARATPGDRVLVLGSFLTASAALAWLDRD
ncbi:bifunctional tetrahydrofolate synthase/dihydrofolate synthase [Lysobacter sp. A3-1-A15]|uniref:bifunctional tetrahydrofolate synthase/dihydrofolate synthase n=1 Tax=Novilysobacter viscosus TaxID=3098602 RepID=UPI002EDAB496